MSPKMAAVVAMFALACVASGCQPGRASSPSETLTPAGLHRNTASDVIAARAAVLRTVSEAIPTSGMNRDDTSEVFPRDWPNPVDAPPYKVVVFVAPAARGPYSYWNVFTVVQTEPGSQWFLYRIETSTG